ncbi:MAG: CDGSH iron-sulfur domain-containing protein [Burkholderiales bacterium]
MTVKVNVRPNGPLIIEGEIELIDPTGATVNTAGVQRHVLCRCGASKSKPYCDGTHRTNGFQASEVAVAPEQKKA